MLSSSWLPDLSEYFGATTILVGLPTSRIFCRIKKKKRKIKLPGRLFSQVIGWFQSVCLTLSATLPYTGGWWVNSHPSLRFDS
jgi:hypothetical protein